MSIIDTSKKRMGHHHRQPETDTAATSATSAAITIAHAQPIEQQHNERDSRPNNKRIMIGRLVIMQERCRRSVQSHDTTTFRIANTTMANTVHSSVSSNSNSNNKHKHKHTSITSTHQ
jgi:hypothetical protein